MCRNAAPRWSLPEVSETSKLTALRSGRVAKAFQNNAAWLDVALFTVDEKLSSCNSNKDLIFFYLGGGGVFQIPKTAKSNKDSSLFIFIPLPFCQLFLASLLALVACSAATSKPIDESECSHCI